VEYLNHRIALVSGGLELGGSTTFLLNLGGELVRRGIPVLVVSLEHNNPHARDFELLNIPLHVENERTTIFEDRLSSALEALRRFEATVVVSTLGPSSYEILRYVPNGVLRVGMVQSDDPLVYQTVEKYAHCLDRIAGVSATIVKHLEETSAFDIIPKDCLPYGVTIPDRPTPRRSTNESLRILYLGRVVNEQKRVHLFPQIADGLEKAGVTFQWTIAGDGLDRVALEAKMKSSASAERVKFLGAVNYAEIPRLLDAHDIFLLASDYEGLPLSLLEAMGHGLVPVVTDLESGIRELVDKTNGLRVPVEDVEGYARAVAHLDKQRDDLLTKSAAARERVRTKFSVAAMTDRWLSIFGDSPHPAKWPHQFRINQVVTGTQRWRYLPPVRSLRRFLKRVKNS
jgi:colanic acid/amylovoran biosynthesis glycosyltransferase